jgi:hypothetical protein
VQNNLSLLLGIAQAFFPLIAGYREISYQCFLFLSIMHEPNGKIKSIYFVYFYLTIKQVLGKKISH